MLGDVLDLHVEPDRVLPEPSQVRVCSRPAIAVLVQSRNGAVVDDLAFLIAPAAINHLVEADFVDVARQHPIDELRCVATGDEVFEQRRHVDERCSVTDSVVFVFVMGLVNADRVKPRPLSIPKI